MRSLHEPWISRPRAPMTAAFLLPLATGASLAMALGAHCTTMCGPIAVAVGSRGGRNAGLLYAGGRLTTYTLLGLMAGSVGQALFSSIWAVAAQVAVSCLFAALLVATALRQWGLAGAARPLTLGKRPRANVVGHLLARVADQPLLLGAATAMIPCGALLTAVAGAATLGSATGGALAMATFALLSSVVLVSAAGVLARLQHTHAQRRVLAVLMLLGALLSLHRPFVLLTAAQPSCHASAEHPPELRKAP